MCTAALNGQIIDLAPTDAHATSRPAQPAHDCLNSAGGRYIWEKLARHSNKTPHDRENSRVRLCRIFCSTWHSSEIAAAPRCTATGAAVGKCANKCLCVCVMRVANDDVYSAVHRVQPDSNSLLPLVC